MKQRDTATAMTMAINNNNRCYATKNCIKYISGESERAKMFCFWHCSLYIYRFWYVKLIDAVDSKIEKPLISSILSSAEFPTMSHIYQK